MTQAEVNPNNNCNTLFNRVYVTTNAGITAIIEKIKYLPKS